MAAPMKLPVEEPMTAVRLLAPGAAAGTPTGERVRWLLQLGDGQRRREAELLAITATAQAVQRALQALPATVNGRLDELAAIAVELGLTVAREIVGDALDRGLCDPTPTVARCLRDCVHGSDGADLVVHLHPDDLAPVQDRLAKLPATATALAAARLLADPSLPRGAVRAETGAGRLRYEPLAALERVAAAVRSAAAGGSS